MFLLTGQTQLDHKVAPFNGSAGAWVEVANRAHAILTQSLPDEFLDEISADAAGPGPTLKLPKMLFG